MRGLRGWAAKQLMSVNGSVERNPSRPRIFNKIHYHQRVYRLAVPVYGVFTWQQPDPTRPFKRMRHGLRTIVPSLHVSRFGESVVGVLANVLALATVLALNRS